MKRLNPTRFLHRIAVSYRVRCARDDARTRHIRTPLGVWACHLCSDVSLSSSAFNHHLVSAHV
jgi:ribosomal protein L37AE/L43A